MPFSGIIRARCTGTPAYSGSRDKSEMFVPAFLLHFDEEVDYSSDVDESTVEFKIIKASPPTKKTEPKPTVEKT